MNIFGIAVDAFGSAYVVGSTTWGLSVTPDAFQSAWIAGGPQNMNGFLTVLNASGSALVYSTYLAGIGDTAVKAIALDQVGDAYVAGWTSAPDFPSHQFCLPASNHAQ